MRFNIGGEEKEFTTQSEANAFALEKGEGDDMLGVVPLEMTIDDFLKDFKGTKSVLMSTKGASKIRGLFQRGGREDDITLPSVEEKKNGLYCVLKVDGETLKIFVSIHMSEAIRAAYRFDLDGNIEPRQLNIFVGE